MTFIDNRMLHNHTLFVKDLNVSTERNEPECSNQLPSTEAMLKNIGNLDIILGGTCLVMTFLVLMLYVEEVVMLKLTYVDKEERLKVMCLLGIYPVFSLCATCGLVVPRSLPMTEFLSTFYLSMAMFIFQRMIVLFIAGESNLVRVFNGTHLPLAVPPLCCICPCIWKRIQVKVSIKSIIAVRLFVLQGALIRPILSFCYGIYFLNADYQTSNKSVVRTINILKSFSMMLAMFGLQIIYRLTRSHLQKDLGQKRILGKFVCFQMVILFGILQPSIFNLLESKHIPRCNPPYGSRVLSLRYNNMVQIFEMFFISLVARYIYHLQKPETPQSEQCEENVQNNMRAKCYAADNPILTVSTDALPQEEETRES